MQGKLNLQANRLQSYIDRKIWIVLYLANGTKRRGQLVGFNASDLFLKDGITQAVPKKAVSTLIST